MTDPVKVTAPIQMPSTSSTRRMVISTAVFLAIKLPEGRQAVIGPWAGRWRCALGHRPAQAVGLGEDAARVDHDVGVEAHEDRRQADERVHDRHKLGHLGHLHPVASW
jgi:hypothetical protein